MVQIKAVEKIYIFFVHKIFYSENHVVCEIIWKNIVEPDRQEMTIWYDAEKMRFSCRMAKAREQTHSRARTHTHTHRVIIFITSCYSTATVVTRAGLIATLYVHILSCVIHQLHQSYNLSEQDVLPILNSASRPSPSVMDSLSAHVWRSACFQGQCTC